MFQKLKENWYIVFVLVIFLFMIGYGLYNTITQRPAAPTTEKEAVVMEEATPAAEMEEATPAAEATGAAEATPAAEEEEATPAAEEITPAELEQ